MQNHYFLYGHQKQEEKPMVGYKFNITISDEILVDCQEVGWMATVVIKGNNSTNS